MSLNVGGNVGDQFYRYKMPPIVVKVEGKGNGIKTVVTNITEIAKALARPPGYPIQYFGCELGAPTHTEPNDRYIINGDHAAKRLQDLLEGFIRKFVLCGSCGNPETNMNVKGEKISMACAACGHVTPVDLRHKVTKYILKNPPSAASAKYNTKSDKAVAAATVDKAEKPDKADKAEKKSKKKASEQSEVTPEPTKAASESTTPAPSKDDDDDFGDDATDEAVRQRALELSGVMASLTATDDLERSSTQRLELFSAFVKGILGDAKFASKVVSEAERLDCKDKGIMVLTDCLLDSETDTMGRIKAFTPLLQRFVCGNSKAQKYFIGALELLAEKRPSFVDKFAHVLKALYDADLLEEEALLAWGEKVSKKYVSKELASVLHDKAALFINWLREAEEESSEEDEEDEVQVDFTNGANAPSAHVDDDDDDDADDTATPIVTHTRGLTVAAQKDDDDDLDIDAI